MNKKKVKPPEVLDLLLEKDEKFSPTVPKPPFLFSKRYFIVILLFISNATVMLLANNSNLTLIEMTSEKFAPNGSFVRPAEFQWDSTTKGLILRIFSYGKLLSFLSAFFVSRLGGSTCWSLSLIISGIVTTFQPIVLRYHFHLFLVCRFVAGMFYSFSVAGNKEILAHWIPKGERGVIVSILLNGSHIGSAIVHPLCGFIACEWGWAMVFYITGTMNAIFALLCLILVRSRPSEDKCISKKEVSYIHQETDVISSRKITSCPHKEMLTSKPIWALFILNWISSSVISILMTSLPSFIKDFTRKGTREVAFMAAIPNVAVIFVSLFAGTLMDFWRKRSRISQTKMHKICIGVTLISQTWLFLGLTFSANLMATMILFVMIRVLLPFVRIAMQVSTFTVAPNHNGFLAGFTTFWFSLGNVTTQTVTDFVIKNHSLDEWNRCFFLAAGMLLFGAVIFLFYGSSEAQSWSLVSNLNEYPKNLSKKCEMDFKLGMGKYNKRYDVI